MARQVDKAIGEAYNAYQWFSKSDPQQEVSITQG
jgi:hypothetical protein